MFRSYRFARSHGFTIVELLVVIVIIGILAGITIVAYNGVTTKAKTAALQSTLQSAYTGLNSYEALNGGFPASLSNAGVDLTSKTINYTYAYNNGVSPSTFCVTGSYIGTSISYYINNSDTLASGNCPTSGGTTVTNYDVNPNLQSNTNDWGSWNGDGNGTMTLNTDGGAVGPNYLRLTFTTATTGNTGGLLSMYNPVVVGQAYTYSAFARTNVTRSLTLEIKFLQSNGAATGFICYNEIMSTTSWQRLSCPNIVTPPGVVSACIDVINDSTNGTPFKVGDTLDMDGAMMTQGSTLYSYGDGNSAGWRWNGTANGSTSTGIAFPSS